MPGHCEIGETELELHPADGHTADGMAIWIGWARVLVAGDYISPVEVPMISAGGSRDAYLATLRRLEPLVDAAAHVVPGHGEVIDGARAAAILREDVNYLAKLPDAELPMARRGAAQRAIHAENVRRTRPAHASLVIQHVAIEVREPDIGACVRFWALLGFAPVQAPPRSPPCSTWVQAGPTQVHLLHAAEPVVAPRGPRRGRRRGLRGDARTRCATRASSPSRAGSTGARRGRSSAARPAIAWSSWPLRQLELSLTPVLRKTALNLRIVDILLLPCIP